MSRSSEAALQQQEQDNLSGMDDYQEWVASMEESQRIAESAQPVAATQQGK